MKLGLRHEWHFPPGASRAKTVPMSQGPNWKRAAKEQDRRQQIQRERRRWIAGRRSLYSRLFHGISSEATNSTEYALDKIRMLTS
jgi:hypothetical protein